MDETHLHLIIMRGPSGSGKTYQACKLAEKLVLSRRLETHAILSTDEFWPLSTAGKFIMNKIGEAHAWTYGRFLREIEKKTPLIIIDNTSTRVWEIENYIRAGRMHGYTVELRVTQPSSIEEAIRLGRNNVHHVSLSKCIEMWERFEPIGSFLTEEEKCHVILRSHEDLADHIGCEVERIEKAIYRGTSCGAWVDMKEPHRIGVGSIVEGIDPCTESYYMNYPFWPEEFWENLELVEQEADELWRMSHGCEKCGDPDPETGWTAINPNCPECEGEGCIF